MDADEIQGILVVLVIIGDVISRPVEVRLRRAGRISDRTTAILLLGRFPALCLLFGLILGASIPLTLGMTVPVLIPMAVFYRLTPDMLREQMPESGLVTY
jgi:hypothetical protein